MKFSESCPVCGAAEHRSWPGALAPFIADRLGMSHPIPCRLLECADCGLRFSNLRLDSEEVDQLYGDYRGEDYYRLRHAREPWYTRSVNRGLGGDPQAIRDRQEHLARMLRREGRWDTIRSVLDFGGDRGQFIPAALEGEKWVYDISSVEAEPGVKTCSRLQDLGRNTFDLVMLCHVLEHAMDPMALVETSAVRVAEGGLLYVEVPLERPRIDGVRRVPVMGAVPHMVIDFLSTATRVMCGWLPPGTQLKVSEHVNFFDERSLQTVIERAGLGVISLEARTSNRLFGRSGTLHCLAEKPAKD